jgi:DNA end-binding protein Ku
MLKKKQAGLVVSRKAAARRQNVVNLMDALRRSIAEERAASLQPAKRRKRNEGQGEMLLPIAGQGQKSSRSKVV